jgi:hypothetical protein
MPTARMTPIRTHTRAHAHAHAYPPISSYTSHIIYRGPHSPHYILLLRIYINPPASNHNLLHPTSYTLPPTPYLLHPRNPLLFTYCTYCTYRTMLLYVLYYVRTVRTFRVRTGQRPGRALHVLRTAGTCRCRYGRITQKTLFMSFYLSF